MSIAARSVFADVLADIHNVVDEPVIGRAIRSGRSRAS
jgi:hypothetical protein